MNAVTLQKSQSPHAVTSVQPSQSMLLVPLSQLRPSRRNVRKTAGPSIDALAASIARVGLLLQLHGGSRQRWRALRGRRRWPAPGRVKATGFARAGAGRAGLGKVSERSDHAQEPQAMGADAEKRLSMSLSSTART